MALYFYFNETTGDLVYSDQATYAGEGYTSLGEQTNMDPLAVSNWVFNSQRSAIVTVSKDKSTLGKITGLTSMNNMFRSCGSLTSLDLSGFDTSSVTSMDYTFCDCGSLISLDLSGFDTSSVTSMDYMFSGCYGFTSLDLSGFDTSSVTSMSRMFRNCSYLASLDLSGFDTSSVTRMDYMFFGCVSLTSIDLSGFDASKVTNMLNMFSNCRALRIIDISPNMSDVLSALPADTYYDAVTQQSYTKDTIPGGSTYVRDLDDLDLVATMVQTRMGINKVKGMLNESDKKISDLISMSIDDLKADLAIHTYDLYVSKVQTEDGDIALAPVGNALSLIKCPGSYHNYLVKGIVTPNASNLANDGYEYKVICSANSAPKVQNNIVPCGVGALSALNPFVAVCNFSYFVEIEGTSVVIHCKTMNSKRSSFDNYKLNF